MRSCPDHLRHSPDVEGTPLVTFYYGASAARRLLFFHGVGISLGVWEVPIALRYQWAGIRRRSL